MGRRFRIYELGVVACPCGQRGVESNDLGLLMLHFRIAGERGPDTRRKGVVNDNRRKDHRFFFRKAKK